MIKEYYRTKMMNFLSDFTIESVLAGEIMSVELLLQDMIISKMDVNTIEMFSAFLSMENKVLNIEDKNITVEWRTYKELMQSYPASNDERMIMEAMDSLEKSIQSIVLMCIDTTPEVLKERFDHIGNDVAKNTNELELFEFLKDYDRETLLALIKKARQFPDETENSIKSKMIISKLRTKLKPETVSVGTINKLLHSSFEKVDDLQKVIDYN